MIILSHPFRLHHTMPLHLDQIISLITDAVKQAWTLHQMPPVLLSVCNILKECYISLPLNIFAPLTSALAFQSVLMILL